VINPLWFAYPSDPKTFGIDLQFFFGQSVLVSPVTEENVTTVSAYLPRDLFYEWGTWKTVQGVGESVTLESNFTSIPVHVKGGAVLPLRANSAMTTTELRKTDFELVVAPGLDGTATGSLYADDGESIKPATTTNVKFAYGHGVLSADGDFGYKLGVNVQRVRVLGVQKAPKSVKVKYGGKEEAVKATWEKSTGLLDVPIGKKFDRGFTVTIA
jgi:alpha-glucosidase